MYEFMTEEQISELHFTNVDSMDRGSRLKQHDNIQKQIGAFEKLTQHAISHFSKEKLYHMLRQAIRSTTLRPKETHQLFLATNGKLTSVKQLRQLVASLADDEAHVVRYFEGFFDDLMYMRNLKRDFDEKIYSRLYQYYYDLEDASTVAEDDKPATTDDSLDGMSDKQKLSHAVRALYQVNQKWDRLLQEEHNGELVLDLFDADSYHELLQFTEYAQFQPLLRLIPDLFVKAYKSTELAKRWWTQANKVYDFLPRAHRDMRDFDEIVGRLAAQVAKLAADVRRREALRDEMANALERVTQRGERCNAISADYERVEELKSEVAERYNAILQERQAVRDALQKTIPGSNDYYTLQQKLRRYNNELVETHSNLKLLSYNFNILQEDYTLELQMQPEFIRFAASDEQRLAELSKAVAEAELQRHEAEKRLVLMRTNCEAIRAVMLRYVEDSPPSTPDRTFITNSEVSDNVIENSPSPTHPPMRYGRQSLLSLELASPTLKEAPTENDVESSRINSTNMSNVDMSHTVMEEQLVNSVPSSSSDKTADADLINKQYSSEVDNDSDKEASLILMRAKRKAIKAVNDSRMNGDCKINKQTLKSDDKNKSDISSDQSNEQNGVELEPIMEGKQARRPRVKQWRI